MHTSAGVSMRAWQFRAGRLVGAVLLVGMLLVLADTAPTRAAIAGSSSRLPMGLTHVYGAKQVIVVTSTSSRSSIATLRAFDEVNGVWRRAFGPMRARVGRNGWSPARRRREGDGTTPEGIYSLGTTIYGTSTKPRAAYRFHHLVPGDYWDENPATGRKYNTFQHSANPDCADNPYGGDTECLWLAPVPYAYFAVINFNIPAAGPYGSAIFLHIGTADATGGCVSVAKTSLVRILHWLRSSDAPRIVLAGPSTPARY
jgi:L,D-peptidoglycan transpeptidase YkuD (ErfK/YbiS/YcfS/YnhG family)